MTISGYIDIVMELLTSFKALSDETRLRIVSLLMSRELNVNEITAVLGMGQSRISRHLKILSDAEILSCRKDGLWAFYTVSAGGAAESIISFLSAELKGGIYDADNKALESYMAERSEKGREYFNGIASQWGAIRREMLAGLDLNSEILKSMKKASVTADLGCGNGELAAMLLQKSERIIGVDRSTGMLDAARRNLENVPQERAEFRLGELSHLPLRDGEADCVVINMVLHYLDEPGRGIDEASRILKKKGKLIIADFAIHGNEVMRSRFGHRWLGFSDDTVKGWMKQGGFRIYSMKRFLSDNGLESFICVCEKI